MLWFFYGIHRNKFACSHIAISEYSYKRIAVSKLKLPELWWAILTVSLAIYAGNTNSSLKMNDDTTDMMDA